MIEAAALWAPKRGASALGVAGSAHTTKKEISEAIMKTFTIIGLAAGAALLAAGAASTTAASTTASNATTAVAADGTVKGHVKFEGKAPELKPLAVTDEQAKGCCPPGKQVNARDPKLIVDGSGGIANVVLYVEVAGAKLEPPAEPLHIDQHECNFEPHVQVVPAGGKIVFLNSDQVSHNVHTYPAKNDAFNKTIAPGSKEEQVLAKGDKVQVKCDIHPWMSSWVFVSETPYYAISKPDGSFEIKGLKPGTYKLEMWHEDLGKGKPVEIVVKDDGSSEPVEIKLGEKKKKQS
jgi:plastocyanin